MKPAEQSFNIYYSSDVPKVKAVLEACARSMDYREKGFEPRVLLLGLQIVLAA